MKPKEVCSAISKLKSQGLRPEDVAINPDLPSGQKTREKNIRAMYEVYQQRMVRSNALDFDDIILVALRLLQEDKGTFEGLLSLPPPPSLAFTYPPSKTRLYLTSFYLQSDSFFLRPR